MPGGYRRNFSHSTRTPDGDTPDGNNGREDFVGAPMLIRKDGHKLHSMKWRIIQPLRGSQKLTHYPRTGLVGSCGGFC